MKRTWIVLTVAEALPYFLFDPRIPPAERKTRGPFYAPGAKWYHAPAARQHVEFQAAALRQEGFTATVTEEIR